MSVIIPVYNCRDYVGKALDSLAAQTFRDFEVICIDDGSTDGSRDVLEAEQSEGRFASFQILSTSHAGPGVARNAGLDVARGEFVLFLDADDFVEPNLLEHAVTKAVALEADMVIWDLWEYNDAYQRDQHPPMGTLVFGDLLDAERAKTETCSWRDNPDAIFTSFQNWPWNKLFRRSFLEKKNLRFPSLRRTEDCPFTCLALVQAERIALLYERLSHYRVARAGSTMSNKDSHPFDFLEALLMLREGLEKLDIWEETKRSFSEWAVQSAIHNLITLNTVEAFLLVFYRLRKSGLRELGVLDRPIDSYRAPFVREYLSHLINDDCECFLFWWARRGERLQDEQHALFDATEASWVAAQTEANALSKKCEQLDSEVESLRKELTNLRSSFEYRFGVRACKIPRAIKNRFSR
ncbi:glycosyltransferase family A protein [Collinsella sp. An2]|uniref:glycosyltransferase family 2 protein n=1 Tax=Collinsella sp. An2 TaxID=1965585 RepID=UPI0013023437|nr:glycosyltransferase family A protein [Collinsella sp. An2]